MTEAIIIIYLLALWRVYKQERKAFFTAALGMAKTTAETLVHLCEAELELIKIQAERRRMK